MKYGYGIFTFIFGVLILSTASFANSDRGPANVPMSADADYMKQMVPLAHTNESHNTNDGRRFPRMWMGSIRWEQPIETAKYSIDGALSPVVDLRYTFQLTPQLRTPDNMVRDLQAGYYILRMVMLRPLMSDEEDEDYSSRRTSDLNLYRRYVSGTERLVQLNDGTIKATMTFRMGTLTATSMRNTLLVQMLPVKTSSLKRGANGLILANSSYEVMNTPNYMANVIRIPFIPRQSSGLATPPNAVMNDDVNEAEESLDLGVFIQQSENISRFKQTQINKPVALATAAKKMNLTLLTFDDSRLEKELATFSTNNLPRLNSAQFVNQIEQITQSNATLTEDMAASFCRLLANSVTIDPRSQVPATHPNRAGLDHSMRSHMLFNCFTKPEDTFTLVRHVHVSRIGLLERDTRYLSGAPMRMNLASNFGTNRIHTNDVHANWTQGFSPIDIKGVIRLGYNYAINESNSRSKFEGTMVSSGIDLEVSQWDMSFTAIEYTPCLAVVPNKNKEAWVYANETKGFYICGKTVSNRPQQMVERFYHVFPGATSAPNLDLLNPKNQPVNMVLRGQRDYFVFLKSIQNYLKPVHDNNKNVAGELREAQAIYRGTTPAIPSILSYPVTLTGPKIDKRIKSRLEPGAWERWFHKYEEKFE